MNSASDRVGGDEEVPALSDIRWSSSLTVNLWSQYIR